MPTFRPSSGFTLIEVLVAFTILALTLGAVFAALSGGITAESRAERVARATLLGRSALAELGVSEPLEAGAFARDFENGDFYEVDIAPIEPFPPSDLAAPVAAYEVTVFAGRDGRVDAVLKTVRLGPVQ